MTTPSADADTLQWFGPRVSAMRRLAVGTVSGLAAAAVTASVSSWQLAVLVGWDFVALAFITRGWLLFVRSDAEQTARLATREDETRATAHVILVVASVVSIAGVLLGLWKADQVEGVEAVMLTSAAALTVVSSWAAVHTLYTLHYAHLYYTGTPGGIEFNEDDPDEAHRPDYRDFAYVAFTIGMTYQVSDTNLTARPVRRAALSQALLSYLFGTVIIATTINIVAGFLS